VTLLVIEKPYVDTGESVRSDGQAPPMVTLVSYGVY